MTTTVAPYLSMPHRVRAEYARPGDVLPLIARWRGSADAGVIADRVTDGDRVTLTFADGQSLTFGQSEHVYVSAPGTAGYHGSPAAPVVGMAHRVNVHEARARFADGAEILVSEHGHETTRAVFPSTTTHTRDTVAWAELVDMVDMWRNRYPNQRYYVVTR